MISAISLEGVIESARATVEGAVDSFGNIHSSIDDFETAMEGAQEAAGELEESLREARSLLAAIYTEETAIMAAMKELHLCRRLLEERLCDAEGCPVTMLENNPE